jgi:hypothetical protein
MYSPVILSGILSAEGIAGIFSHGLASTFFVTPVGSRSQTASSASASTSEAFARKPGGWRMPIVNLVMGPPVFAPLLFGTSAYLGVITSYLQREEDHGWKGRTLEAANILRPPDFRNDIRVGRFQKHFCVVTAVGTLASGAEACYFHYKNLRYKVQWSPILLCHFSPVQPWRRSERVANTLLPFAASLAMLNGCVGTACHLRGTLRRSSSRKPLYNILYGPPIFVPMLFAACGMLGMMAYLMRRERS